MEGMQDWFGDPRRGYRHTEWRGKSLLMENLISTNPTGSESSLFIPSAKHVQFERNMKSLIWLMNILPYLTN